MTAKSEEAENVAAFDALYTTNELQKLKILLPCAEPSMQRQLAVYIKYRELQYTMQYSRLHPSQLSGCGVSRGGDPDLRSLCRQLSFYSTPEEIRQLEQLQNMLQTLETMQEMSQTMSVLQELFPDLTVPYDGDAPGASGAQSTEQARTEPFSMMDMMLNMLTPEQRNMYEMFRQTDEKRTPDRESPKSDPENREAMT